MSTFIKIYVLISLWFWAGMLLSQPLRKAFGDMHWRVMERIYDTTLGRVVKAFDVARLYIKHRTQAVRISIVRSLIGEDVLQELMQKNLVAAISRARQMDSGNTGVFFEEIADMIHLATNKPIDQKEKESAVNAAFKLCDTVLFKDIITKVPRAQERILVAFDQLEGRVPYDSVINEEFRKFIRE
ncbi:MAG: hypothetical protein LBD21_09835 [Tannerellaceae bacterium]|jgi:hypothetical protein|nr:hypothetical protein [Tannerellaceae bacterium]